MLIQFDYVHARTTQNPNSGRAHTHKPAMYNRYTSSITTAVTARLRLEVR